MDFVDPALATAETCYLNLLKKKMLSKNGNMNLKAYISVPSPNLDKKYLDANGNLTRECKYGRNFNDDTVWTKIVPYGANDAKRNTFIKESLGATWNALIR